MTKYEQQKSILYEKTQQGDLRKEAIIKARYIPLWALLQTVAGGMFYSGMFTHHTDIKMNFMLAGLGALLSTVSLVLAPDYFPKFMWAQDRNLDKALKKVKQSIGGNVSEGVIMAKTSIIWNQKAWSAATSSEYIWPIRQIVEDQLNPSGFRLTRFLMTPLLGEKKNLYDMKTVISIKYNPLSAELVVNFENEPIKNGKSSISMTHKD